MPNYRRAWVPGGMFFFTLVTFDRRPILTTDLGRRLLHDALADCAARWAFTLDAMVLLPDHLHAIWALPPGDGDFFKRWAFIKRRFTAGWLAEQSHDVAAGQTRWDRRRSVWQPRFMEHAIRDEKDRDRHFDYVHYNPVKHGHAKCPHAWAWSSFERLVRESIYPAEWCCRCDREPSAIDWSWADKFEME